MIPVLTNINVRLSVMPIPVHGVRMRMRVFLTIWLYAKMIQYCEKMGSKHGVLTLRYIRKLYKGVLNVT